MTLWRFLLLFASALLFCACPDPQSSGSEMHCKYEKQILAAQTVPSASVTDAHIYLDTSDTMKGFLSDAANPMPVTLYQEVLQSLLLEQLHAVGLNPRISGFSKGYGSLDAPLRSYALKRDLYREEESDIIGALEDASKQPATLSIVVTDNTQDLLAPKPNRAPGFDRAAFTRTVVDDLVKKDFGVWLLGFKSGFRGNYFSVQLTSGRRGVHTNQVIALSSPRPVYCWVVSRDVPKGRRFVTALFDQLQRRAQVHDSQGNQIVYAIELAPGVPPRVKLEEPTDDELRAAAGLHERHSNVAQEPRTPTANRGDDVLRVRSWRSNPPANSIVYGDLELAEPRTERLSFVAKIRLEFDPKNLPLTIPVDLWSIETGDSLNLGTSLSSIPDHQRPSERSWRVSIPYARILSEAPARRDIEIPFFLLADLDASTKSSWLAEWSTDDDTTLSAIDGKSLYLLDVVRGIIAETLATPVVKSCMHLHITKE